MNDQTTKNSRRQEPVHQSRAQDVWDEKSIHAIEDTPWVNGQSLAAPPARAGMRQRWIRVGILGVDDPTNVARKTREGWKPRPVDSLPANFPLPTISHGQWSGCIGVEGSVLMEMPERLAQKRDAYDRDKREKINSSIADALQAQSNPNMPITQERKTQVGRLVKVAEE